MTASGDGAIQSTVNITCRKCGQVGALVWERHKGNIALVSLSRGFYERISKKHRPFLIELVCEACGTIQPRMEPPAIPGHTSPSAGSRDEKEAQGHLGEEAGKR